MLRFSLARLTGIVGVVLVTVFLVIQIGNRNWIGASAMLLLLLGCLWLAFWGDRRLRRGQSAREAQRQRDGEAFTGFELDVGLRWFKWGVLALLLGAVVALTWVGMLPDLWRSGLRAKAVLIGAVGLMLLPGMVGMLWLGVQALKGDALLKLGPLGLQIASWPLLPWKQLHGADLQEIDGRGGKQWQLVLALDESFRAHVPPHWWVMAVQWPLARWAPKQGLLRVPLAFLDENPHKVLQAVRHVGARQGAPLVEGWRYTQPVAEARELRRRQREAEQASRAVDLSLEELRRLGNGPTADPVRLAALDQRIAAEFERMQSTSEAHLAQLKVEGDRLKGQFRSAFRGLWIALGLVMAWVVTRIVLALT
jgi:hypothetical protein